MPFAKAVLTRRRRRRDPVTCPQVTCPPSKAPEEEQLEDLKDADRLFHDDLVSIGRQLSALVLLAGQIFDELCGEYRLIVDRTDRINSRINGLSGKVDPLDAKAAEIPESSISTVASHARHFETDYAYHGLAIFDPSNRPLSVQALYGAALPTPVGHLRECDSYRTDDLRGAQIFSRTPIALNKWTDDLLSIAKARQKVAFLPKSRTCQPLQLGLEAKSLPNILQTEAEPGFNKGGYDIIKAFESSQDVFSTRERSSSPSVIDDLQLPPVLMVNIDVSGSGFSQLRRLHAPSNAYEVPDGASTTTSLRRRDKFLTRPKTISGISDLVFHEIDIDPPALKPSRSLKSRNSPRNPLSKTLSQTLEIYAPKERRTLKDLKRRTKCFDEGDEPKSCGSWRHSLKSVFRISRSKSRDLWNITSPSEEATSKKSENSSTLKRSMSLPRSLKSSTKHSAASFGSFRSSSVEGRLNFRVVQLDKLVNSAANSSASKSPKPVAGERLGRSLTKSLSQVRIGQTSRNQKSFDVPCRPQSMEIRMPSVDEEGRPLLSLYNNASVINFSSSIATVKSSSSTSDQQWMKSLSIIKLRNNENKEQKDDCQSSSGRWSGSSGLTEKQVVLESDSSKHPTSLGSATLIGQCPSETSVNIKDSAMCLHYNPNDSSFAPIDKKTETYVSNAQGEKTEKFRKAAGGGKGERETEENGDNAFVERKVSRKSFISSNSLTRALSVGRKKSAQPSRSGGAKAREVIHSHSQHSDEINDEDSFPQKPPGDEFALSRSAKSDLSKPKLTYRSSFMLKLKNLGKSSKAESSASSVASRPAVRPTTMLTMGDCISQASKETGRSMTPSLPPGESNELKKLGELADRLAAAKAKVGCAGALSPSLSSSSSSGSCVAWNRDGGLQSSKSPQSLVLGEVNQMLQRGALSVLPSSPNDRYDSSDRYDCSPTVKSQGYFSFPTVNHFGIPDGTHSEVGSISADPPLSPTKLELRASIKVLKMTELESILETSHECETTSPYLARSKKVAAVHGSGKQANIMEPDSHSDHSSTDDYADSTTCENRMASPGIKLPTTEQPLSPSPPTTDSVESTLISESGSLVPATARLIISSPVASRACFINNPFKRSLCQPMSADDFTKLCTGDLELHESPSPDSSHFIYPEVTKTSVDVFKHSAAFPVTIRERVDPSNYGRSWYDGIACDPLVPVQDAGEPSMVQGLGHPAFLITNRLTNPGLKITKDQVTGSLGYQSQNLLPTQKPDTAFYRIPCHSFSTSSPTTYDDASPGKANGQSIRQKGLEVSNGKGSQMGQTGLGKKCARVVFPSSNSGILLSQSNHKSDSKPTRTTLQGDQKPRSTVNLLHLKSFRGADDTNLHLPSNGGQAFRSDLVWPNSSVPNVAQGVKCNTLPRSHLKQTFPESVPLTPPHHLDLKCTSSYKY